MFKLSSSLYFKFFLAALCILSFGFIGALAVMDPQCSHCTLSLAHKAMTGAKILTGGWLIVGTIIAWDTRRTIHRKFLAGFQSMRLYIATAKEKL